MSGSIAFDRIADKYDETRGGEERARWCAAVLREYLPARRLVEIGVGTGIVAKQLADSGFDVVGLDISRPMLERARERLGHRVAEGDAHQLPFATSSVTAAYSVWVLHLVADAGQVFREVARVLEPGGRYIVVGARTVDEPSDVERISETLKERLAPWHGADHPDRLDELAVAAGLQVGVRGETQWVQFSESPLEAANRIEQRTYSWLWDIDDNTWLGVVAPALDELRGLPDPETPRPVSVNYQVPCYDKPG
jgi:SAM-dependent methyltransferase